MVVQVQPCFFRFHSHYSAFIILITLHKDNNKVLMKHESERKFPRSSIQTSSIYWKTNSGAATQPRATHARLPAGRWPIASCPSIPPAPLASARPRCGRGSSLGSNTSFQLKIPFMGCSHPSATPCKQEPKNHTSPSASHLTHPYQPLNSPFTPPTYHNKINHLPPVTRVLPAPRNTPR